jgi:hypothetical protein
MVAPCRGKVAEVERVGELLLWVKAYPRGQVIADVAGAMGISIGVVNCPN